MIVDDTLNIVRFKQIKSCENLVLPLGGAAGEGALLCFGWQQCIGASCGINWCWATIV